MTSLRGTGLTYFFLYVGVSIATMASFAFNTMIGQVTPIALTDIGWRFYLVFVSGSSQYHAALCCIC